MSIDFTAFKTPILAVPCPSCQAPRGSWCRRPSGHRADALHKPRGERADEAFIAQHGEQATIQQVDGKWVIDPEGYIPVDQR